MEFKPDITEKLDMKFSATTQNSSFELQKKVKKMTFLLYLNLFPENIMLAKGVYQCSCN